MNIFKALDTYCQSFLGKHNKFTFQELCEYIGDKNFLINITTKFRKRTLTFTSTFYPARQPFYLISSAIVGLKTGTRKQGRTRWTPNASSRAATPAGVGWLPLLPESQLPVSIVAELKDLREKDAMPTKPKNSHGLCPESMDTEKVGRALSDL